MAYVGKNPKFDGVILDDQAADAVTAPKTGSYKVVNRNGALYNVDSSGTETPVGSGAGEVNVITSPSTATGWVASAAGVTVATSTTASDLPLSGIAATCLKITPVSSTDYARYRFTMPESLKNRKLKLEWFQRPLSGYAAGDFKVEVYQNAASNYSGAYTEFALSTDSSGTSSIPSYTGKYTTTFDADSSDYYEIRIVRTAGTTALNLANIVCGPGLQPQGAVIGEWTSYTPTYSAGFGTVTNNVAYWRRVGSEMEVTLFCTTGTVAASVATITLPSGYTINTSALRSATGATESTIVGGGAQDTTGYISLVVNNNTSANVMGIGGGTVQNTMGNGNAILNSTKNLSLWGRIPISEWAGNGTVNLAQSDVEYVSNSSTSDAADTTSFAYGPSGSVVPGSLTAARKKRVSFQTPIQDSSYLIIEIQPGGSGSWIPLTFQDATDNISPYLVQNSVTYGIGIVPVSSTAVDVQFGQYAANSSATFGGVGTAWGSVTASTRYRIRKTSGGNAVGFGNVTQSTSGLVKSAGQLLGTNTSDVASAGYVGEVLESTVSSDTSVGSTATWTDLTTLTLTAGDWELSGVVYINANGATFSSNFACATSIISASGDSVTGATPGVNRTENSFIPTTFTSFTSVLPSVRAKSDGTNVTIDGTSTASQVVRLKLRIDYTAGTPKYRCRFTARRTR